MPLMKHGDKYNFVVLHVFCTTDCSDGGNPFGTLILGVDGSLYGTTISGGANGGGTIYRT